MSPDEITQLLLTLFGRDAEVVVGEGGEPVALRLTIRFDQPISSLQDVLKHLDAGAEGVDVADRTQHRGPARGAGGF